MIIDFDNEEIEKIELNNKAIHIDWNGLFIKLAKSNLLVGKNVLNIKFLCNYAKDGCGLHKFIDSDSK